MDDVLENCFQLIEVRRRFVETPKCGLRVDQYRGQRLLELVRDRATKERAVEERNQLVQEMFRRGVLILGAGRNAVRFAPPMVITRDLADTVVDLFDESLGAVSQDRRA